MLDSITLNRTDGALVRVTTVVPPEEEMAAADHRIRDFIAVALPVIPDYIPQR
jgi:hypothetical protein